MQNVPLANYVPTFQDQLPADVRNVRPGRLLRSSKSGMIALTPQMAAVEKGAHLRHPLLAREPLLHWVWAVERYYYNARGKRSKSVV